MRAHAIAAVLALAPAALSGQSPVAESLDVERLSFVGAHAFDEQLLRSAIVTSGPLCRNPVLFVICWAGVGLDRRPLDEAVVRADALRLLYFYYQRGYRDADVEYETVLDDGGVGVVFRVEEGTPVRVADLDVAGAGELFRADIAHRLPLRPGEPFSLLRYEASRDTLISMLRNRGYAHGEVLAGYTIPADAPHQASVRYEVLPGTPATFGPITVTGAARVSPGVVRRMLTFHEGDEYRETELLRSQRNLFGLDIFRHAEINADLAAEPDSVIPVTVQVNEGNVHRVRAGVGMSTAECGNAEGRWTSRNFLGGARRLEARGRIANVLASRLGQFPCFDTGGGIYDDLTGSVALDFSQPWFFSPANTFGAGLFMERRSLPEVFVRTARGGYLSLTRAIGPRTSLTVGYRPEITRLDVEGDLFFCISFVVCAFQDLQVLREPHWLAPIAATFVKDRSNAIFAPNRGYVIRLDAEYASPATGSDFAYTRLSGDLSGYWDIGSGMVLAGRVRPGWARSSGEPGDGALGLHPQKRFFAGGSNGVRGFPQYRLGPKVLSATAQELALPIDEGGAGCSAAEIDDGTCDAQPLSPDRFHVRPVGGAVMLEGSLELRLPLVGDDLGAVAFVDFGQVWRENAPVRARDLAWTPGLGIRYFTAIGPMRMDVGYNPGGRELLPVITNEVEDRRRLRHLDRPVLWDPNAGGGLFRRLQLHFSIGQAF